MDTNSNAKAKQGDDAALVVFRIYSEKVYLIDFRSFRYSYKELKEITAQLVKQWHINYVAVENRSNGNALVDDLKDILPCSLILIDPSEFGKGKFGRFQYAFEYFEKGLVLFPNYELMPEISRAIDQLCKFTGFDTHEKDDIVDAIGYALGYIKSRNLLMPIKTDGLTIINQKTISAFDIIINESYQTQINPDLKKRKYGGYVYGY